ncbi:predicted protein [Postia placenta Mad-698-R]|uniref:Uncharacterized protein n=1 Tax=Postia placenta MAD-698-R-SB12 TaxID=670580 RepID=A0A1X6MJZ9_9APHY|nr:hypothetical protein POSPLADRAFT_1158547 [Postia placenta MAD-698-R-SB12]EED80282.1 predicted protein [Postia placenta Mad-698-R]OSX56781.1 hypothetical protein POSPLADRAFT_1158547 [Postia placenta MAD-698-R-SB12]
MSSTSGREEVVQLGPTGPADVEDLLDLSGALLSFLPHGEGLELDLAVYAGGDAAQLSELHLCSGGIVEIAKASLKRCKEGCFVGEGGGDPLSSDWRKPKGWGRPTKSYRSDGELCSNLRLGTSEYISKGRLCALVRAQLVRAQHADAAPGAVDNDVSISGR